jgi:ABC-type nitrate/sulfonate/bicarbonate transport system permease component
MTTLRETLLGVAIGCALGLLFAVVILKPFVHALSVVSVALGSPFIH